MRRLMTAVLTVAMLGVFAAVVYAAVRPASDDAVSASTTMPAQTEDVRGPCDEAEHANDPRCTGTPGTRRDNSGPGSRNSGPGSVEARGHDRGEVEPGDDRGDDRGDDGVEDRGDDHGNDGVEDRDDDRGGEDESGHRGRGSDD